MSFIWPAMLLLLLALPLAAWLYFRLLRRRRAAAVSYGSFGAGLAATGGRRRHVPPAFFLAGLAILVTALARPQAEVSLPRVEGTVILAFDVSGSMAATDLQPTRMEAAKTAARAFVEQQPATVQVGVVAFSEGGFTVQPPTNDPEEIFATINRLAPQRGTSIGQGILVSLDTIAAAAGQPQVDPLTPPPSPTPLPAGSYAPAAIILLTDGENTQDPDPLEAAQAAADRGVRVYTVGVGSPAGIDLEVNGFTVHTQLDEGVLQRIAQITGGTYYNAQTEQDLQAIYDNLSPQFTIKPEKMEVTSIFAGAGILVLLLGGTFSMIWFNRVP